LEKSGQKGISLKKLQEKLGKIWEVWENLAKVNKVGERGGQKVKSREKLKKV
jgi:hypothetical protein